MSAPTTTGTATVFAPDGAIALILTGGTGHPYDHTRFINSEDDWSDDDPGTRLPVVDWPEDPNTGFRVVEDVPADIADQVYLAGKVFELGRRVWTLERQLDFAATFLLGAAKTLEDEPVSLDKPDIPQQLSEVMRRLDVDRTHFGWILGRKRP